MKKNSDLSAVTTNIKNKFDKAGSFAMNIKTLEILNKLATELDEKGATKVSDYIEEMMEKYSQEDWLGRSNFPPGGQAETDSSHLDTQMAESVSRMHESRKGNIQPKGDPYSYQLNADETFTVATAPQGREQVVGRSINPGSPGYDSLKAEAIRMGLMSAERAAPVAPVAKAAPNPKAVQIARTLGLRSVPSAEEARGNSASSKRLFRKQMSELATRMNQAANSGMFGGGTKAALLDSALKPLFNPTLDGVNARDAWPKIAPIAQGALSATQVQKYKASFDAALKLSDRADKFAWLAQTLEGGNMADDELATEAPETTPDPDQVAAAKEREAKRQELIANSPLLSGMTNRADDKSEEEEEEVMTYASESAEEKIQKIASLKEDYKKIFWFEPGNPFNRSNTKFKR